MVKTVRYILAFLLQIIGCSTRCPWPALDAFAPHSVSIAIRGIRDVRVIGDDDYLVVSEEAGAGERRLSLTRIRGGAEERLAMLSDLQPAGGDGLIPDSRNGWWYSRAYRDVMGRKARVFFVSDDGSGVKQTQNEVVRKRPLLWLPLRGRPRSGALISLPDDTSIAVDEVSESEVKPLGRFPTIFPGSGLLPSATTAERLPDARIALFSLEEPAGGAPQFTLRLFDRGQVTEKALPCADRMNRSLATAVDESGRVSAVGLSPAGEVVAMLIAPDAAERSPCRVISLPGEIAAGLDRGSPAIVAGDHEFFAAWIRTDGHLRVCQFRNLDSAPAVIDAGEGAATGGAAGTLVEVNADETLTLAWKTDRGIGTRRIPQALAGYTLVVEVEQLRCDLLKRIAR